MGGTFGMRLITLLSEYDLKMADKFKCKQCGKCCSHIQGLISERSKSFLREFAYGKLPIVSLLPIEKTSFPLWDFEAKRFLAGAKDNKIHAKIKPARVIFDLNDLKTVIVTYSIDSDVCTFLKDGKCIIYNRRAFICRSFPFQHTHFLETGDHQRSVFGSCSALTEIKEDQLYDSFGDIFLAAVQHDIVTEWVNKQILALIKKKIIRPAINHPYKFLMKRIDNSEKIDFSDYLVEKHFYTRDSLDELIKRFENFSDAKLLVK
jgi:Fe-S-cluster containining protein